VHKLTHSSSFISWGEIAVNKTNNTKERNKDLDINTQSIFLANVS